MTSSLGFMEKIYRGVLTESAFRSYPAPHDPQKIRYLLEKYGELLKACPPHIIEKLTVRITRQLSSLEEKG